MMSTGTDQRQRDLHAAEKVVSKSEMFDETKMGIPLDEIERFGPRNRQEIFVRYQVCNLKFRQSALTCSEEISRTPYFQVNFSNFEAIKGFQHRAQAPDRLLFLILI